MCQPLSCVVVCLCGCVIGLCDWIVQLGGCVVAWLCDVRLDCVIVIWCVCGRNLLLKVCFDLTQTFAVVCACAPRVLCGRLEGKTLKEIIHLTNKIFAAFLCACACACACAYVHAHMHRALTPETEGHLPRLEAALHEGGQGA